MTETQFGSEFLPDVEGLKAVAVLLLVIDHLVAARFSPEYMGIRIFFPGMYIRVLMFQRQNESSRDSRPIAWIRNWMVLRLPVNSYMSNIRNVQATS